MKNQGMLRVFDLSGKPVPRVYVKVYAQHNQTGEDFFFRDGYTDIRGKLDYANIASEKLS